MMARPPCWPEGQPCPNWCAEERYARTVHNHVHLTGPWKGWRLAGRDLISPTGEHFSPQRLEGLAWRVAIEQRRDATRARNAQRKAVRQDVVTVLRVRNSDWHAERFGTRAG
ncbi:DUF3653 domain-containing protein [Luteimonas suaedae]|uniref:DUF3653 domain-containing protein n=1 Tax=Luteimonas suaedae TaxID=2605430 RepID=UPI0011EC8D9E|nr:DUF3653 domain-containing protein [Luteimonas suaedae]